MKIEIKSINHKSAGYTAQQSAKKDQKKHNYMYTTCTLDLYYS